MNRARQRIGDGLDRIESSHDVGFDPAFRERMNEIGREAEETLPTEGQANVVKRLWRSVMTDPVKTAERKAAAKEAKPADGAAKKPEPKDVLRRGLTGEQFGNLLHQKGPIDKIANHSDPGIADFGAQIEQALRDLMQRKLPPEVAAEYRSLRYQWKNMKTIEPVVGKSPGGDVDPSLLNTQVSRSFKDRAYRPSELDQLAKAGMQYMAPQAVENRLLRELLAHSVGASAGASLGSLLGPVGTAGGAVIGSYAAHRLAGMARARRVPQVAPQMPAQPRLPAPNSLEALVRGQ